MTNQRFPLRRLPDDLCSEVLKTMELHEIIAFSFISKNTLSLVQSLCLPLQSSRMQMCEWPAIYLNFGDNSAIHFLFNFRLGRNDNKMRSLDDMPDSVYVTTRKPSQGFRPNIETKAYTWSNQGMTLGEWSQHLCSIFRCNDYKADFTIRKIRVDIQSLRNIFPKLRKTGIHYLRDEPDDQDIQTAQIVLRAFLPHVQIFRLSSVLLQDNISIQHIGMTNLKELELYAPRNLKFDNLLTLNVERCTIFEHQFSFRDLNRFFKLWMKGSNRKLKRLTVEGENIADWNVLMKGLQPEETRRLQAERAGHEKRSRIQNCYGIWAKIKMLNVRLDVTVTLTVLN